VLLGRAPFAGAPARQEMALALSCLDEVSAGALADRDVHGLSGGELQRVHLARVLCWLRGDLVTGERPRCLLLDEPATYLDFHAQDLLARTARRVAEDGVAVVAVVHDLNLAAAIADDVVVLQRGRVVAAGPPAAVLVPEVLRPALHAPVRLAGVVDGRPVLFLDRPERPARLGAA
jgi:iron complex transport system ATP-binding protein